jgi:hypothetical protein
MAADEAVARLLREMQVESNKRRTLSDPLHHLGEEAAPSLVGQLPPEVLSKIFDLLCHSDKIVCRSVSHSWLQVLIPSILFLP